MSVILVAFLINLGSSQFLHVRNLMHNDFHSIYQISTFLNSLYWRVHKTFLLSVEGHETE